MQKKKYASFRNSNLGQIKLKNNDEYLVLLIEMCFDALINPSSVLRCLQEVVKLNETNKVSFWSKMAGQSPSTSDQIFWCKIEPLLGSVLKHFGEGNGKTQPVFYLQFVIFPFFTSTKKCLFLKIFRKSKQIFKIFFTNSQNVYDF